MNGSGNAIVVWYEEQVHVVCTSPELGYWLAQEFNRHFPEVKGVSWPEPTISTAAVKLEFDLNHGVRAEGADIEVEIFDPMDRRLVRIDDFDLGGTPNVLSTVIMPCRRGTLRMAGTPVAGAPRITETPRASSTAFLADAEVWCLP
jgi:hypothetical protein